MVTLTMCKGLPASGKSTWAKKLAQHPQVKRVNKDDLREMVDSSVWSKGNEKEILAIRDDLIYRWLRARYNVIVDDTNLDPKHEERLRFIAKDCKAEFVVKEFDVTVEEAITRDLARPRSVGERVIRDMYQRYLAPKVEPVVYVPPADGKPAIICDIDGTLAHMTPEGRLRFGKQAPYMWDYVHEDALDPVVSKILDRYADKYRIILLSGRDEGCRPHTEAWLQQKNVYYQDLFMRAAGDNRDDTIVKRELFERHVHPYYNVHFVLDDRNKVVKMWRDELGLKVLQVADGPF